MGEHYTKNTVEVDAWCKHCNRQTRHRVDGGRLGPCLVCIDRRQPGDGKAPPAKQEEMF